MCVRVSVCVVGPQVCETEAFISHTRSQIYYLSLFSLMWTMIVAIITVAGLWVLVLGDRCHVNQVFPGVGVFVSSRTGSKS